MTDPEGTPPDHAERPLVDVSRAGAGCAPSAALPLPTAGFEPAEGAVDEVTGPEPAPQEALALDAAPDPLAEDGPVPPTSGFEPAEGSPEPAEGPPEQAEAEGPPAPADTFETAETAQTAETDEPDEPATPDADEPDAPTEAAAAPGPVPGVAEPAPREPLEAAAPVAPRTVGRAIADALRAAGVRLAFTVPGESFLGLLDALGDAGIRVVTTRHEGGAAFMAEAHGQLTGRPAAALGTRAVGAANLAIGIHTARQDSAPMFALVGQVERPHHGHEAFQETDLVATIGGLAVFAAEPTSVEAVGTAVGEAVHHALDGRPGPVLLSLPEDLLDQPWPDDARIEPPRRGPARATDDDVRATIELLASARRPVIVAGGGVLRARTSTDLLAFAELLSVPIIAGWRRGDVISNDHPLYLGMAGLGAPTVVRERLLAADAVLVIGCRLNEPTGYEDAFPAAGQRWIHVDIEPARPADLPAAERTVSADARAFLRAANDRLRKHGVLDAERVQVRQAANAADRAAWEAATVVDDAPWDGPGVHPGRVVTTLRRVLPDEAIVTTDAGNFAGWIGRGFRFRKPGTFVGPDVGRDGLRAAGGHRGVARPSRPAGRGRDRGRWLRDDHGRARDGRPRARQGHRPGLRQRALRHHPDVAGAAGDGRGHRHRARRHRFRGDRPWPWCARASPSSTMRRSSRRCARRLPRSARRSSICAWIVPGSRSTSHPGA